jgi:hypothetical protein
VRLGALDEPRRSLPPPASAVDVVPTSAMKALILDGDSARPTTDLAEVAAAHAAGTRFWLELDERTGAADHIGLRKVEDFAEYVQIVMHGVREEDRAATDVPLALSELDLITAATRRTRTTRESARSSPFTVRSRAPRAYFETKKWL